jgi:hypothetical protein
MKLTIDITAEDINHGEPGNCYECPVAIATKRACEAAGNNVVTVTVSEGRVIVFTSYGERWQAVYDDRIDEFICDYDSQEDEIDLPSPFSTTLEFTKEE